MNFRFDIVIIGDSKTGHEILDKIAANKPSANIAFISKKFKSTTMHDYVNVRYFRQEVEYITYKYRMFGCCLSGGDRVYSTHVIVASGLDFEPLMLNNEPIPCVYTDLDDIPKTAKDQPALVICNKDSDAKFALEVAKKYKQVYLCSKEVNIAENVSATTAKKLAKTENLAIIPNTSIKKVFAEKGALQKVALDNYSEIKCSAIFAKTDSKPAIKFIPTKIVPRENDYPIVNDNCESSIVPKCFVVGSCLKKYTKAMEQKLIDTISKDF